LSDYLSRGDHQATAVSESTNGYGVARFNPDGSPDPSFGGDGWARAAINGEIFVGGLGGDDSITVLAAPVGELILNGNGGSDNYTIHFGDLANTVRVADDGAAGIDAITVYDTGGNDTIYKDNSTVTWGDPELNVILHRGLEVVTIHGGDGNDTITDPGSETFIFGDAGDDTLIVTATDGTGVVVDGGDGSDTYILEAAGSRSRSSFFDHSPQARGAWSKSSSIGANTGSISIRSSLATVRSSRGLVRPITMSSCPSVGCGR